MVEKGARSLRHIRLSSRAMFAAERLAEIAGLPASELVEMVLLELAASGELVEASVRPKGQRPTPVARRGSAPVIPIERGRRRPSPSLGQRVETLRPRSEPACTGGERARLPSTSDSGAARGSTPAGEGKFREAARSY